MITGLLVAPRAFIIANIQYIIFYFSTKDKVFLETFTKQSSPQLKGLFKVYSDHVYIPWKLMNGTQKLGIITVITPPQLCQTTTFGYFDTDPKAFLCP